MKIDEEQEKNIYITDNLIKIKCRIKKMVKYNKKSGLVEIIIKQIRNY